MGFQFLHSCAWVIYLNWIFYAHIYNVENAKYAQSAEAVYLLYITKDNSDRKYDSIDAPGRSEYVPSSILEYSNQHAAASRFLYIHVFLFMSQDYCTSHVYHHILHVETRKTSFHLRSYIRWYCYHVTTEEERSTRSWHLVVVAFYHSLAYNPCSAAN